LRSGSPPTNSWNGPKYSAITTGRTAASWTGPRPKAWTWYSTSTSRVRDN
jgi:hypothetical protein